MRLTAAKTARTVLSEFLNAALPTDEERRALHRFGVGLEQLALTDPDGAGRFYAIHIGGVIATLTDALARFIKAGQAARIAESATAFSHGLGTLLMTERINERRAKMLISDYLDRHV